MAGATETSYGEVKDITEKSKNKFVSIEHKQLYRQSSFKSVPGESFKNINHPLALHKAVSCGDTQK